MSKLLAIGDSFVLSNLRIMMQALLVGAEILKGLLQKEALFEAHVEQPCKKKHQQSEKLLNKIRFDTGCSSHSPRSPPSSPNEEDIRQQPCRFSYVVVVESIYRN